MLLAGKQSMEGNWQEKAHMYVVHCLVSIFTILTTDYQTFTPLFFLSIDGLIQTLPSHIYF